MVKNLFLPLLGVVVFIIAVGWFSKNYSRVNLKSQNPVSLETPGPLTKIKEIKIGTILVKAEVADTLDKRVKGLSGRNSMDWDSGMLFVFETKDTIPTFWMKDMLFPLDILWISNGKIIKIDKNVPLPASGSSDQSLPTYTTSIPVEYVLEVNAGFADKYNVKVGDTVDFVNTEK